MHNPEDLNLAGLATVSLLALFFPAVGLIGRRARAVAARRTSQAERGELNKLVLEEANALLHTEARREQPSESSTRR